MATDCVFCKIIRGEIPGRVIYEDEHTLAFLDIAMDVDGHTLVIPKEHVVNILDCGDETLRHVMDTVRRVSRHYVDSCAYTGVNVLNASGKDAQQSVFHLHFHIIPRKENDGVNGWPAFGGAAAALDDMHRRLAIG